MKWSQLENETNLTTFDVQIYVADVRDVEAMQIADIFVRELRACGIRALVDDRGKEPLPTETNIPIRLELNENGLRQEQATLVLSSQFRDFAFHRQSVPIENVTSTIQQVLKKIRLV